MFVCILGRQPELSSAELEAVFGKPNVSQITPEISAVQSDSFDLSALGGTVKYGRHITSIKPNNRGDKARFIDASREISSYYIKKWQHSDHKITLGISAYGFDASPRDVQKTGLIVKSGLKKHGVSVRLVPSAEPSLSTAVSHNNKLGLSDNKVELLIINSKNEIIIAESCGAQNITAYARRDQNRPKRDAFVGMLPPKLAQIMLNLAIGQVSTPVKTILDPFCGTGTVLQEAMLRGFSVIGSDLSEKMVSYTQENLSWIQQTHRNATGTVVSLSAADAMSHHWKNSHTIDAVVCETYLGQPFSAPPSPQKLKEVVRNCDHIISTFLKNIRTQLEPNTALCVAVPAWQDLDGNFTHLPLTRQLESLGYTQDIDYGRLIYHRPGQVVARELLVMTVI